MERNNFSFKYFCVCEREGREKLQTLFNIIYRLTFQRIACLTLTPLKIFSFDEIYIPALVKGLKFTGHIRENYSVIGGKCDIKISIITLLPH